MNMPQPKGFNFILPQQQQPYQPQIGQVQTQAQIHQPQL